MAIYLNVEGLKGEVSAAGHEKWIECNSLQWGVGRAITTRVGGGADREASQPSISEVTVSKLMDKATPNLMLMCADGTHHDEALLTVRKAGGSQLEYLTVKLEGVLITSVSTAGSGGEDQLTENVTLNFAKVHVIYQPQDAAGAPDGGPVEMGWNVEGNTAI